MASKSTTRDKFANVAYLSVTESAAGTLTFAQLSMATNLMSDKFALVIHRAEFYFANMSSLNTSLDYCKGALCMSDRITTIDDLSQPEVLWYDKVQRIDLGTAATGMIYPDPAIRDFSALPGGGVLVPADRLYAGVVSSGAAAAMAYFLRLYYTVMPLSTEDYWELIEARRIMTT